MLVKNYWQIKQLKSEPTRSGFGQGLVSAAKKNKDIIALCCDLTESVKLSEFKAKYPERFVEMGVAEQNMAGVGAGLALSGKIPFIASYAVFSPGRNWDQIRVSTCYNNANVKIVGAHAGVSVGPDGATHQALEDIALMRVLPHMTVLVPADAIEAAKATEVAARHKGPVYLRLNRSATPVFTTASSAFKIGQANVLVEGDDVTIIACGPLVYQALLAARQLKKNHICAAVINCHTIKPIDQQTIIKYAKKTRAVVTVEEHQQAGGLGSAVAEVLARLAPTPMEFVGVTDSFGQSGQPEELLKFYQLDAPAIIQAVKKVIKQKKS